MRRDLERGLTLNNNDQLTKYERLRLECFAQAISSAFAIEVKGKRRTLDDIFEQAKAIESFLKASNPS